MKSDELELWNKIKSFQFDKPNIKLTFAKRLAKENEISLQFANQIIDEYRKFIFLCCVSRTEVSPSHWVDQAWHLHLTYTKSYWIDLCKNTLNRDLHHNPTEGGKAEHAKFTGLYKETLELYESYFSATAPAVIWAENNEIPTTSKAETEQRKTWIIPKPEFTFFKQKASLAVIAVVLLTASLGCTSYIGLIPLVIVLGIVIAVFASIFRKNRNTNSGGGSGYSSGCGGSGVFDTSTDSNDSGGGDCGDSGGDSGGDCGCSGGCGGGCGGGGD